MTEYSVSEMEQIIGEVKTLLWDLEIVLEWCDTQYWEKDMDEREVGWIGPSLCDSRKSKDKLIDLLHHGICITDVCKNRNPKIEIVS